MISLPDLPDLPVSACLPELDSVLESNSCAVLAAPPGAGKTTLVPLHLLQRHFPDGGRVLLLEPRRLAARSAARRMADLLDETPGESIGYTLRMESCISKSTRIQVATQAVLSRMILDDPELGDISAIIFDEFHERSLDGDFSLALALDVQSALRPDLKILVMSATLDVSRVSALLDGAPVVTSTGKAYPVDIRYFEGRLGEPIEDSVSRVALQNFLAEKGSMLIFLPGRKEIERVQGRLEPRLPANVDLLPLHGGLTSKAQDAAIRPANEGRRKIVLATSIAETSITIDGVRIVIDCGLSRSPRYEPLRGLKRLETVRVSRSSADQRSGRAGRTESGIAIRLWRREQTAALEPYSTPEILQADLSGLVLDCAAWGVRDPSSLRFLDPPPRPAITQAQQLLQTLGAIDEQGRMTKAGKIMRQLALPPRLAHMVANSGKAYTADAARLAVLLTEQRLGGRSVDLELRYQNFLRDRSALARQAMKLAGQLCLPLRDSGNELEENPTSFDIGKTLALAFPDRIARARGQRGHFLLTNGKGARLGEDEALAGEEFLVIAEVQGRAASARIVSAAVISASTILEQFGHRMQRKDLLFFDRNSRSVRVRHRVRLGSLTISEALKPAPAGHEADQAILRAVREHGLALLPWNRRAEGLLQRLTWLHAAFGAPWPDMSATVLLSLLDEWLAPFLTGSPSLQDVPDTALYDGLMLLISNNLQRQIGRLAPETFDTPSGRRLVIDYSGDIPRISVRVQELYGMDTHPTIAEGGVPLVLELLSPARRPIQTTNDLPRFWRGSWSDVRAEMRGRYPKHAWPPDPSKSIRNGMR